MTIAVLSFLLCTQLSVGFVPGASVGSSSSYARVPTIATGGRSNVPRASSSSTTTTSLNVWWFGGTEQNEVSDNDDSCELVAVRIERTSANSRKIAGDIIVPASLEEVWSILTDYNRLSIHVPNLKESRITRRNSPGQPGDGSYKCRLYQVGAQKIIGFDFSASVTMDMTERIISERENSKERKIGFKCVDSQFFSEFDGVWNVKEQIGPDGQTETVCSYVVDVRPKGPVPVAALEWRIREDVPTNLRAVKAASVGAQALPTRSIQSLSNAYAPQNGVSATRSRVRNGGTTQRLVPALVDWDRDETMAKYL